MDFASIYNMLMTVALGFISWSLKELYSKNEKRQSENKIAIEELGERVQKQQKDLYQNFVMKEDHYRDINALEKKIDNIKDILLDIKKDIGELHGRII